MQDQTFPIVELFYSIQGEGRYTGRPSVFVRLFGCNFQCNGFSNRDAEGNVGTIPIKQVTGIEELSNNDFTKGCDSRYSWHKDYAHLARHMTANQIASEIIRTIHLKSPSLDLSEVDIIFTGGEPMMQQSAIIETCRSLVALGEDCFRYEGHVTIETNASLAPKRDFVEFFNSYLPEVEVLWSCSPKLSISGEPRAKAWSPRSLARMLTVHNSIITFKFVVETETDVLEAVEYMDTCTEEIDYVSGFYLMPVGATAEQQMKSMPFVAEQCMKVGANLSARMHVFAFGNELGT